MGRANLFLFLFSLSDFICDNNYLHFYLHIIFIIRYFEVSIKKKYMILLSNETKKTIKSNPGIFVQGCVILNVKQATMNKYLDSDGERLTELNFINYLVQALNKPLSELIEGGKVSKLLAK